MSPHRRGVIAVGCISLQDGHTKHFYDIVHPNPIIQCTMAKIKFTAFLADMRGKVNGTVFTKNRAGAIARTKVTPTNPSTNAQQGVRSVLTQFSQGWRALSQAARDAFNAATTQFQRTNVFGDAKTLSGHQLYVGLNSQLAAIGAAPLTVPPVPLGANALTSMSVTSGVFAAEVLLAVLPAAVPTGHTMIIDATAPQSAGISNVSNRFRQIDTVAAAGTTSANIWTEYLAKFGAPQAGQKVFVRARFVRIATGEVSASLQASAIVAA